MDDYYNLLGVESDAPRDEIRAAYRDRKAALDASSDAGKTEAAQLNKAWNVLSDPYQRGRYDERLSQGSDDDDSVLTEVQSNGRGKAASSRPARQPRAKRDLGPPTLTPPPGTHWPKTKQRIIAMVIDLVVLLVFYIGFAFIGHAVADSQHPGTFKQIDKLTTQVSDDQKAIDNANKDLSTAQKNNASASDINAKKQAVTDAKNRQTADQKELDHLNGVVGPTQNLFGGLSFLLAAIYLIVPSIFTGRTLGKRIQHLKTVRDDGSRVSAWDVTKRYGVIVAVTYAGTVVLGPLLGPLVPVIVLFGVLQWMRNANMQGMHDRIAHTMVVSDASE
jgi:curved DNA-binding protein CbpA